MSASTPNTSTISSAIPEFAKKRRLAERGIFLEKGSVTATAGSTTAVTFAEPWNSAPVVYLEVLSGSEATVTGSFGTSAVTNTGFNIYAVQGATATVRWIAARMPNQGM